MMKKRSGPPTNTSGQSKHQKLKSDAGLYVAFAQLKDQSEQNADPVAAIPMKAYLKNKFDLLGIKSPKRREIYKEFRCQQTNFLLTEEDLLA